MKGKKKGGKKGHESNQVRPSSNPPSPKNAIEQRKFSKTKVEPPQRRSTSSEVETAKEQSIHRSSMSLSSIHGTLPQRGSDQPDEVASHSMEPK